MNNSQPIFVEGNRVSHHFPGRSWSTMGPLSRAQLCNSYMNPKTQQWDFSTVKFLDSQDELMIDTLSGEMLRTEDVMSACLGSGKVKICQDIVEKFLNREPDLFDGVELELV